MDTLRGVIWNKAYATQVRDFSGLRFGTITPTDIDGLIEYRGKGYVFIETKWADTKMPDGQRLALERLCDDLQKAKPTLLIVASHETEGDIDVAETQVREYRWKSEWRQRDATTRQLVEAFVGFLDNLWGEEGQS